MLYVKGKVDSENSTFIASWVKTRGRLLFQRKKKTGWVWLRWQKHAEFVGEDPGSNIAEHIFKCDQASNRACGDISGAHWRAKEGYKK